MEQNYDQINGKVWKEYNTRKERKERLIKELEEMKNTKYNGFDAAQILNALRKMESNFLRFGRAKWKRNDFRTLKILGKGGFGSVSLVRHKNLEKLPNLTPNDSSDKMSKLSRPNVFAMKTLKKEDVKQKNQVGHVIAERDIMSEANNNDWIVKLQGSFQVRIFLKNILLNTILTIESYNYYNAIKILNTFNVIEFQDKKNLYFIMEYVPGGDLMEKLIRDGKFDEDLARYALFREASIM